MLQYSETIKTTYTYKEVTPEQVKILAPGTEIYFEEYPYSFVCGGLSCAPFTTNEGKVIVCYFGFDNMHSHESQTMWQTVESLTEYCNENKCVHQRHLYTKTVHVDSIERNLDNDHILAWNK